MRTQCRRSKTFTKQIRKTYFSDLAKDDERHLAKDIGVDQAKLATLDGDSPFDDWYDFVLTLPTFGGENSEVWKILDNFGRAQFLRAVAADPTSVEDHKDCILSS